MVLYCGKDTKISLN
jgi:phospholipid-transporting ATPase